MARRWRLGLESTVLGHEEPAVHALYRLKYGSTGENLPDLGSGMCVRIPELDGRIEELVTRVPVV